MLCSRIIVVRLFAISSVTYATDFIKTVVCYMVNQQHLYERHVKRMLGSAREQRTSQTVSRKEIKPDILGLKLVASRDKSVEDIQALCRRLRLKKRTQLETWLRKRINDILNKMQDTKEDAITRVLFW